tara:strand:- start:4182 stop:4640 length:459 start_codon:yes stop_codon:yes gene_type:complete
MSKLWDDLKENMKEWSSSAVEKAEEMSRKAMAKTEEMTRISKIKFDIHQLQRSMGLKYEELGRLAYTHTKKDHMANFSGVKDFFLIVNRVDEIKSEIGQKQNEIEKIKQEYGIEDHEIVDAETSNPVENNQSVEEDTGPLVADDNNQKNASE